MDRSESKRILVSTGARRQELWDVETVSVRAGFGVGLRTDFGPAARVGILDASQPMSKFIGQLCLSSTRQ